MPELPNDITGKRVALLIDGDNAQPSLLREMIAEAGKHGSVTIRRIYGDWTTTNMTGWKDALNAHAIQPIQQFRYTVGKNATDSAMIIDAMDILHEGIVSGFCLVSSDSDYTRLATRIREQGVFVMGVGQRTTPSPFVKACEIFVFTDNLSAEKPADHPKQFSKPEAAREQPNAAEAVPLLKEAVAASIQEDGWAHLANVGHQLRQSDPDFDARTFGFPQLSQLIRSLSDDFEIKEEKTRGGPSSIYARLRV